MLDDLRTYFNELELRSGKSVTDIYLHKNRFKLACSELNCSTLNEIKDAYIKKYPETPPFSINFIE